jgi:hypothetical protein
MRLARIALILTLLGVCAWTAQGATINVFSLPEIGWQISGSSAFDVNVALDNVGTDANGRKFATIEISKKFRYGPDPQTGVFPSILMDFTQIGTDANTVTRIFIADESVTNLTGVTWTDYHWILMRHGVATFNQDLSNVGGVDGFSVDPFAQHQWTVNDNLDQEVLSVSGGIVPANGLFLPGDGLGNLVIDIVPDTLPGAMSFTFKQLPTYVPEPASMTLLLLGAAALRRRRR